MSSSHSHDYDRLAGLFLGELSLRNSPRFPDSRWFTALSRADDEFQRLGPLKLISAPGTGHNALPGEVAGVAEGSGKQLYANYGDHSKDVSQLVNGACTRWLSETPSLRVRASAMTSKSNRAHHYLGRQNLTTNAVRIWEGWPLEAKAH